LVVLLPLMVAAGIAVRLTMGTPLLFRQTRPGLRGEPFDLLKFRTMNDVRLPDGSVAPDRLRLTRLGRLLRRLSIDELPQLWNVVRGDMSLVGPRPLLMEYLPRFTAEQARRHEVKPGVTGWAQVHGRNAVSWQERLALDVWYVDHSSFGLDLRILFRTVFVVIRGRDVAQAGHVSMEKFEGNHR